MSVPIKVESAEPPEGAGAGAGHVSPAPMFVGLNVPVVNRVPGRLLGASSSSVRVTPVTASPPPTSDIMMAFCPPGPTRSTSMSAGEVWLKLFSLTVTFWMMPAEAINMFEG